MKDKGFTLVELLAAMVILALLIFVGTMTVSNIFDNTKDNYYHSLENTLSIAGNEYFNDNREDRPIDDYNFVDMETLVNHEYMEELKTYDGKDKCKSETGVYIYNEGNDNGYEVCLVCGEYKSEGVYCNGKKSGTIHITGNINDKNGPSYNPLLSYSGTKWINASNIWIHFSLVDEGIKVSKYTIYNANGNSKVGDCTASGNKCSMRFDKTGSYYVEAFDGNNKVGNRKYFNVKLDNTPPTMDLKNLTKEFLLDNDKIVYDYENEVINVNDDNGYKEVKYTLIRYNPSGNEDIARDKDIKDADFKIHESLQSGKYDLYITVTDFAGNKATQRNTHITFYIKYNVDLQYFDNKDNKHDAGTIKVYTYGKYTNLPDRVNVNSNPQEVSWYLNANMVGSITTTSTPVEKTGYHVLYGKEAKFKSSFNIACNDITYDTNYHKLASIPTSEQGKYRLLVYYDNKLMANEARDARTYTIIALLNSEYTWADGSTKAKSKQCTIKTKKIAKPTCDNKVYNGKNQQIVKPVDSKGNYSIYNAEYAYYLNDSPLRVNADTYSFTAKLNGNKNYSWEGSTSDFSDVKLNCVIERKKVTKPGNPCISGLIYNGKQQLLFNTDGMNNVDDSGYFVLPDPNYQGYTFDVYSDDYIYYAQHHGDGHGAGTYDNAFILGQNYQWSDGSTDPLNFTCEINPVTISWPGPTEIEYCGTPSNCPLITSNAVPALVTYSTNFDLNMNISAKIDKLDKENDNYMATIGFYSGGTSIGSESGVVEELLYDDYGHKPTNNFVLAPLKISINILDSVAPKCGDATVSSSGTITFTATDNYQFSDGKTSATATETITKSGTYTHTFEDKKENSVTCSITVKKQKATATCSAGNACSSAGCYERYSCRNKVCGCDTYSEYGAWGRCNLNPSAVYEDEFTECTECNDDVYKCHFRSCTQYKSCVNSNCNCKTYNTSISTCGCATWGDYGDWVDDDDCSAAEASNHSSKTSCRFVKK